MCYQSTHQALNKHLVALNVSLRDRLSRTYIIMKIQAKKLKKVFKNRNELRKNLHENHSQVFWLQY